MRPLVPFYGALALASLLLVSPVCRADKSSRSKEAKTDEIKIAAPAEPKIEVKQEPDTSAAPRRPNGSLWNTGGNMVEDLKARRVGDLLTIIVQENTTASSSATTKADKSDSAS